MGDQEFLDVSRADVCNKRVIVRGGFDVPVDDHGNITDDSRLRLSVPTIRHLIERKAKVILIHHHGRPKGQPVDKYRADRIARRLSELLGRDVNKLDDCMGKEVESHLERMNPGDVVILENLRFRTGEKDNDLEKREEFARKLASYADVYVNDAFSNSHHDHASITGIPRFIPGYYGFALINDISAVTAMLGDPERPFVAVLGGLKAEKSKALLSLVRTADKILIGGGLSFLLAKLKGLETGDSKYDDEATEGYIEELKSVLGEYSDRIMLPEDVIARRTGSPSERTEMPFDGMRKGWAGMDIGPETIKRFSQVLTGAKTIVFAGPPGRFEEEGFLRGTKEVLNAIAGSGATTVIGGGESAAIVEKLGLDMGHISSGGGAFITLLTEGTLPAMKALEESRMMFNLR